MASIPRSIQLPPVSTIDVPLLNNIPGTFFYNPDTDSVGYLNNNPIANYLRLANYDNVVRLSDNQTIAGTKTFSDTISGNISGNAGTATYATGLTIYGTDVQGGSIITTTIGSVNQSYLILQRGDQTFGSAFERYRIAGVTEYTTGTFAGSASYIIRNASNTDLFSIDQSGVVTLANLTASQAVVTDSSKNLISLAYASTNTSSALVQRDSGGNFSASTATLTEFQVAHGAFSAGFITTTTTGSANTADLFMSRGDAANGFSRVNFQTAANTKWAMGLRSGNETFQLYDNVNSVQTLTVTAGAGITSIAAFAGSATFGSTIQSAQATQSVATGVLGLNVTADLPNATGVLVYPLKSPTLPSGNDGGRIFIKEDSSGNSGFSISYNGGANNEILNIPANTFAISRHNSSSTGVMVLSIPRTGGVAISEDTTLNTADMIINTAGKTLKIKQGSNACAGTNVALSGGTATVSTTAVATGDIILLNCTTASGTQGIVRTSISNGASFAITSSSGTDASTYSWVILKAA